MSWCLELKALATQDKIDKLDSMKIKIVHQRTLSREWKDTLQNETTHFWIICDKVLLPRIPETTLYNKMPTIQFLKKQNGKRTWIYVKVKVIVAQSCLTLCNHMDCGPPGCSDHGILQARILEWVAMPSSRGSSWPRDQTYISHVSCIGRWVLYP